MKCILVTGISHAGTRLLVRMLHAHPHVQNYPDILNGVAEYAPLHKFFMAEMGKMSMEDERLVVGQKGLYAVLDEYTSHFRDHDTVVVKMPFYPLDCLDLFEGYFGSLKVVYAERSVEGIRGSWVRRGEDVFVKPPHSAHHLKKTLLSDRRRIKDSQNLEEFIRAMAVRDLRRLREWDKAHPLNPSCVVRIEQLSVSDEAAKKMLTELGLSTMYAAEMLKMIDVERLRKA